MSRILADGVMAMLRSPPVQRIRLVLGKIRMAKKTAENMSPQPKVGTSKRGAEDAVSADRLGRNFRASELLHFCTVLYSVV